MGKIICVLCVIRLLFWRMFLNSFCYAFFRPGCAYINKSITTRAVRLIFSVLKCYLHFDFFSDNQSKKKLPGQYLVISNHQSLFDILVYMRFLGQDRMKFMAKYELINHVPIVSVMLKTGDHCVVKRHNNPSQAMMAVDRFATRVKEKNYLPVIFPEGSRSKDGRVHTFHTAGFRRFLNQEALPVAVCALDGGYSISSLVQFIKRIRGQGYRVKVLKVFPPPRTKEEQLKVLEEGKALIEEQLKIWRSSK